MAIRNVSTFPLRSDGLSQDAYSTAVEASLTDLPLAIQDFNAAATLAQLATTTTSSSSVLIGTGSKTFTVQAGLGFTVGMTLRIANTSTAYMTGDVTSYSSTTLVVNVTSVVGSGTFASWFISQAAVGANTAGTISFTPAGNIAATNVQTALQELDTEKLSSAAGAVTGTNLEDITTAETVGSAYVIPVVTKDVNGRVTGMTTAQKITSGTVIPTTSGTSIDVTGVPSGVRRITIEFMSVGNSDSSQLLIQLGDSGGIENTSYLAASGRIAGSGSSDGALFTAGFGINVASSVARHQGHVVLTLSDPATNTWTCSGNIALSNTSTMLTLAGTKALSAALDRFRLTTLAGTGAFNNGSINYKYE